MGTAINSINIAESRQAPVTPRNIKKFVLKITEQYKNGNNTYKLNSTPNFIKYLSIEKYLFLLRTMDCSKF